MRVRQRVNHSNRIASVTNMIRMDHTHVAALFHRYTAAARPQRKQALATNACLALEIHAQLEEEIFYPALARVMGDNEVLAKSKPEHDEVRAVCQRLRAMTPDSSEFDSAFHELIRGVLHHVADEESTLLPAAERLMPERLGELGMQMTRRRLQLMRPHAREIAASTIGSFPVVSLVAAAGALTLGVALFGRGGRRSRGRMPDLRKLGSQARAQQRH